ncbi:MAG: rRNA adenine dimethyltransferase family protein [Arcanobacterium sp.]|nr:rRNA adenine dimethyltransferase family protein [Arcanobacterium sp.]
MRSDAPERDVSAPALLGPADIRAIARAVGVSPTKKLGQNFVHDGATVRKIVRDAHVSEGSKVLEVGPGLGSLTLALLEVGAVVSAVEIDPVLAAALPQTVNTHQPDAMPRLAVLTADALSIARPQQLAVPPAASRMATGDSSTSDSDAGSAQHGPAEGEYSDTAGGEQYGAARRDKRLDAVFEPEFLVANLPYNVAVPILLTLLAALPSVRHVTVMVQAEVADRLVAQPGSKVYGVPSVKLSWYGQAWRGAKIARTVFWPIPNVDSALVHMDVRDAARRADQGAEVSRERVFAVIDAGFSQRRKTLRSALASWAGSPAQAEQILRRAGVDPGARAEKLELADFAAIAGARDDIGAANH